MTILLAWRNIWRNRRRTWITVASIAFAVVLVVFSRSATIGVYDKMTDNVVRFSSGYIQVHQKGYWDEQIVDNSFESTPELEQNIRSQAGITSVTPRFQSFALASTGEITSGVLVVGIIPEAEEKLTSIREKIESGAGLEATDTAVLIGAGLAQKLRLGVGDTLLLLSQGYHGSSAYARMPVKGIVRFPSPELNKSLVWMPLDAARRMFDAPGRLTALSILIANPAQLDKVHAEVSGALDTAQFEVMDWKTMLPELNQVIEADRAGHTINAYILYVVVTFGIFGTILMMTAERRREFGILVAIGMRKGRLAGMLVLEILMIALLGVVVGECMALPVVWWFREHPIQFSGELADVYAAYGFEPIMPTVLRWSIFIHEGRIVFWIGLLLAVWPVYAIWKMREVEAMR